MKTLVIKINNISPNEPDKNLILLAEEGILDSDLYAYLDLVDNDVVITVEEQ